MDNKETQVTTHPVETADSAPRDVSSQATTADAEGVGTVAEGEGNTPAAESPSEINDAVPNPVSEAITDAGSSKQEAEGAASQSDASAMDESQRLTQAFNDGQAMGDDSADMTMEEIMAQGEDSLSRRPVHRGMILNGTIIMLSQEGIVVDVGAKVEGVIPYNQLFEGRDSNAEEAGKMYKPGEEMQVYVVRSDLANGTIILSKKRADEEKAWNLLYNIHEKKLPVEVEIIEKVRGGLVANLGVRAFLPASQVDIRRINDLAPYVNQRLKVRIIELNRKRNRVIVSRRSILEEEVAEQRAETLAKLEPGAKLEGEVVEITDFGAFVNLGGVDGLVHRSEITHGRFNHPKEVLNIGDSVKVEVLDMDLERERINLSIKSLISDPWENVLVKYQIGDRVAGAVTNLTPFGAFVEIEPGLEGLIHVSEMSWTKRVRHPKEILTEGDHVEAMVLKIDLGQKRVSLGLRQTQPDPWSSLPDRYPPGTEVNGPVTGITDFGVFMEIEEGIEGLIHISELSHDHIDNVADEFKKGDELSAVILNIDPVEQRASLSRKRLLPFTPDLEEATMQQAPASNRGGRKGRRGGRRSQGIDYDYSYAAADSGGRATAKLGDVYADLFAQFGLSDSAAEGEGANDSAEADHENQVAAQEAPATEAPAETQAEAVSAEAVEESAAAPQEEAPAEVVAEAKAEEEVDPENAIDAAEAAAMLTAAFREGKRPASSASASENDSDTADDKPDEETREAGVS